MRRLKWKLTHSEQEVVSGIYSDQRFTKKGEYPVLIEYQSNGEPKYTKFIEGHRMITIDLRQFSVEESLSIIAQRLIDLFEAELDMPLQTPAQVRKDHEKAKRKEYRVKSNARQKEIRDRIKKKRREQ